MYIYYLYIYIYILFIYILYTYIYIYLYIFIYIYIYIYIYNIHIYLFIYLLPQDIHGPEDREMLARLAASTEDDQSAESEAAIEKYLRSVLAVENILTLDRLRQVRERSPPDHALASQCSFG